MNTELIKTLCETAAGHGEPAMAAEQLLHLYEFSLARPAGCFLELGTDRGQATEVILEAIE